MGAGKDSRLYMLTSELDQTVKRRLSEADAERQIENRQAYVCEQCTAENPGLLVLHRLTE